VDPIEKERLVNDPLMVLLAPENAANATERH
jgi:hypothetical protein